MVPSSEDAPGLRSGSESENTTIGPGLRWDTTEQGKELWLTVQGDMLTIKGQRKEQAERKQGSYLVREQRSGTVYRSIQLPVMVDSVKAQAHFEHGLLRLTLPKAEATKPRRIKINGGQAGQTQQINGNQPGQAQQLPIGEASGQKDGQLEHTAKRS